MGATGPLYNWTISGSSTSLDPLLISFEYEFVNTSVASGHAPNSEQIVTCYMNALPVSSNVFSDLSDAETEAGYFKVVSTFFDESDPDPLPNTDTSLAKIISKPAIATLSIGWLLALI